MSEQRKEGVGLTGSTLPLSYPQVCGSEQKDYSPLGSLGQVNEPVKLGSLQALTRLIEVDEASTSLNSTPLNSPSQDLAWAAVASTARFNPSDPHHLGGVCSGLEKAWLWSALPDDWRSLSSPLDRVLEPGSRLSSIVAKVQDKALLSSVPPPPPPVVGVRFYSNDVRLVRALSPARGGGPRQKCGQISASSLKNAKFTIANSSPDLFSLLACTYPTTFPADGRIVKAHHKALLQRIRDKFGAFSYFTAFEYQKRGAVHFHTAISFNLSELGEVVTVKRKAMGRRFPSFLTVLDLNRWLFEAWLDIISRPGEVRYKKEVLDWSGLPAADIANMKKAFYEYNSAVSWEVMREDDGAKHYMVKELSGLKSYQKIVPDWYDNPGRHFLYSRDMRVGDPIEEFAMGDSEVRDILEAISWAWLPRAGASINKTIWNVASAMIVELLRRGYSPLGAGSVDSSGVVHSPPSLDVLRRFGDVRMLEFMGSSDLYSEGTVSAWFAYNEAIIRHKEIKWSVFHKEALWKRDFLEIEQEFSSPPPPSPPDPPDPPRIVYAQSELDFTSTILP